MHGDTDVGFGLVIGSALIAFGLIPPLCYFGQKCGADGDNLPPLALKSWAVCRDTGAFVVALSMVSSYMFLNNAQISVYESSSLLFFYLLYIIFMVCTSAFSGDEKDNAANRSAESGESVPLFAAANGADEPDADGNGGCWRCVVATYTPMATVVTSVYAWTIPPPPEDGGPQTATGWVGTLMTFAWLALISEGIYELVLLVCDLTTFLNPATLGAVLLSVGAQVPDALGAVAMARAGMVEGAISSTLSSQVISITVALGLPWTLYLAMGNSIQLAHHTGTKIADTVLIFILMVVVVVFFSSVMLDRRGAHGGPQLSKEGSIVTVTSFWFAYFSFFIVEVMSENGFFNQFGDDDGVDDD